MEGKKFQNQNELPVNVKIDKKGQTELNLDFNKIEEPIIIYNKEIHPEESPKINEEEDDVNLRDLTDEQIEEMKMNDPDKYFEIIDKLIKEEERRNNEQIEEVGKLEEIKNKEELDRLYAKTDDDKWYDK